MKKQTVYNRLQQQYKKLNNRIQKAIKTGRFHSYTQFKQTQLLNRLKRCSFQMKQLGAGVAVVAALGMATPVVGQAPNFIEKTNAMTTYNVQHKIEVSFVDLDGDGDMDILSDSSYYAPAIYDNVTLQLYYENTGTAMAPVFTRQYGVNTPLNSELNAVPTFVDMDGDGDLDCFTGNKGSRSATSYSYTNLIYYENQGSSTNPNFVAQTGVNNPLDSVNSLAQARLHPVFVDIDNDGDQDFFGGMWSTLINGVSKVIFYENTGTAMNPSFEHRIGIDNPLDTINSYGLIQGTTGAGILGKVDVKFADIDADGDQDAYLFSTASSSSPQQYLKYFKNDGTASTPSFGWSAATALDSIVPIDSMLALNFVDIDGDTDIDVYARRRISTGGPFVYYSNYYENQRVIVGSSILVREEELITISPNPTSGNLYFDKSITGTAKVYDISGHEIFVTELYDEPTMSLSTIENGLYFLIIENATHSFQAKILIQK